MTNTTQLLALARKGRDAWNAWRHDHPDEAVNFMAVDFTSSQNNTISFAGFHFGDDVRFDLATFGNKVRFYSATFGDNAWFIGATFGGYAQFSRATFGDHPQFDRTTYGKHAQFDGATFGDDAWFNGATLLSDIFAESLAVSQMALKLQPSQSWGFTRTETSYLQVDDSLGCSVFAPGSAQSGSEILIQAFAYESEKADEAFALALEQDKSTCRRGFTTLSTNIENGSTLTFDLKLTHATVDISPQHLRWVGKTGYVGFLARIAGDAQGTLPGRLIISQNGMPIGRILFIIEAIQAAKSVAPVVKAIGKAEPFEHAFISYAAKDRTEVLKRTQMLDKLGIHYIQDMLSLNPDDRWAQGIYRSIDRADLFLFRRATFKMGQKRTRLRYCEEAR